MSVNNNQLRQRFQKRYNYFAWYCNNIKTTADFLLSKQEIENGLHEDVEILEQVRHREFNLDRKGYCFNDKGKLKRELVCGDVNGWKLSLLDLGMKIHPNCIEKEEMQINYYYNHFVYAMTHIMSLAVLFDKEKDKYEWEEQYELAYTMVTRLKKISSKFYGNDIEVISEWNYMNTICNVTRTEPEKLFGYLTQFTHYKPKTNPTIQEMLEWMDVADSILKRKRECCTNGYKKRFTYDDENIVDDESEKNTNNTQKATDTKSKATSAKDEKLFPAMKTNSKKYKLETFGIGLFLVLTIVFNYMNLFYMFVALIFVYGIYQTYRMAKNMDTDKKLFEEDVNIKDRIKKSMGGYIDIPYYGYKKISDNVVDEVYHFFKDKKTKFEVSITKIKEFELPYDRMDAESLVIMADKYNEYQEQEEDGFAELQKIKSYGMVLENVK